jgi:hypothetical protein
MQSREQKRESKRLAIKATCQKVASAVARYLAAASTTNRGRDCQAHAQLTKALLKSEGIDSRLVGGYAAWRVGTGDADMIAHHPNSVYAASEANIVGHFWVEAGDLIIDPTTWQFQTKLEVCFQADGMPYEVLWPHQYLVISKSSVKPFKAVRDGYTFAYHYDERPELAAMAAIAASDPIDRNDLGALRLVYANPFALITGPALDGVAI